MQTKRSYLLFFAAFLLAVMILFPSCYAMNKAGRATSKGISRLLHGDPRKNCNHAQHSLYMQEQEAKRLKKKGIGISPKM
ncbi:MAG: hypothetical protein ACKVTZ_11425 [Bacteroidia bacterium]